MKKTKFIEALTEGESVADLFMVKTARLGETRTGKAYLALTLGDRSGEINGPVWENAEKLKDVCKPGNVVQIQGQVQVYRDSLQLRIERVLPVDADSCDLGLFIQSSRRDQAAMEEELQKLVRGIKNPYLKSLLDRIVRGAETGEQFQLSPAAKGLHHAYHGGLLEHSLSVATVASMLASHYPGIDRDLVVAGALLHDIGKISELDHNSGVVDYTDIGRLKGHLVIGCELIGREAALVPGFPESLLTKLQHLILSHHGRLEFGSPVVPMTPEAILLSFIDDLDAKMNLFEQLRRKMKTKECHWSEYQRSLDRFLLLSPIEEADEKKESIPVEPARSVRQHRLF
ncbi:MAG: metal-dependent phosphohydrolase [Desulfobacterales bacterium]|nr:MAG: metal-dependent phosphohydrolase [Desulfobacterales bacterium]